MSLHQVLIHIAILLTVFMVGCANQPSYSTIKTRDGEFEVMQTGQQHTSKPPLVIELGLGSTMADWQPIVSELGKDYHVFNYHRAGIKGSTAWGNKDPEVIHQQLRNLVAAAGIQTPFVLIGHSMGGLLGEYYARQRPNEIAGLVLVDARPASFTQECQRMNAGDCNIEEAVDEAYPKWIQRMAVLFRFVDKGVLAEVKGLSNIEAQTISSPALNKLPGLVLSATNEGIGASPEYLQLWSSQQAEYQKNNPHWQSVVCDCGHFIHDENPTLFLENVHSFMSTLTPNP